NILNRLEAPVRASLRPPAAIFKSQAISLAANAVWRLPDPRGEPVSGEFFCYQGTPLSWFLSERAAPNPSSCRRGRQWPEFRDHSQDVGEEISGNGDLGHLECDIAAVAHDFRADLDQLRLVPLSVGLALCDMSSNRR